MSAQPIPFAQPAVPKPLPDLNEIARACKVVVSGAKRGRVVEVRAFGTPQGTWSGYFTDSTLVQAVYDLSACETTPNVYWTIQELKREVLQPGKENVLIPNAINTTNDKQVERFLHLPIDCDPVRDPGVSSTDAEKAAAYDVAQEIRDILLIRGIESILADSGNGYHVLVRIDLVVNDASKDLVQKLLVAFNAKFGTPEVGIDSKVFNPSRILKIYGSVARKGAHTAERPWRTSALVDVPENVPVVSEETLWELLADFVKELPAGKLDEIKKGDTPADPNSKDPITEYRNNTLTSIAGTLRNKGLNEEEIHAVLTRINEERCVPVLPEHEIDSIARSIAKHEAGDPARDVVIINSTPNLLTGIQQVPDSDKVADYTPLEFKYPAVQGTEFDFVLGPANENTEGWFPRGDPSLIGGPSGGSKTTLMLDLLDTQLKGQDFLGHKTFGLPYLVIGVDRGAKAQKRTAARMRYEMGSVPTRLLQPGLTGDAAVRGILHEIEELNPLPAVVFIEGCDLLLEDASKMHIVAPFLNALQKIAEHYHIAIVCSLGTPKMKKGEGYEATRDKIYGTVAWGRMTETILLLSFEDGDDTKPRRSLVVQLRNGPTEKYDMEMSGGRLVPRKQESGEGEKVRRDMAWMETQGDWFTAADLAKVAGYTLRRAEQVTAELLTKRVVKTRKKVSGEVRVFQWNNRMGRADDRDESGCEASPAKSAGDRLTNADIADVIS